MPLVTPGAFLHPAIVYLSPAPAPKAVPTTKSLHIAFRLWFSKWAVSLFLYAGVLSILCTANADVCWGQTYYLLKLYLHSKFRNNCSDIWSETRKLERGILRWLCVRRHGRRREPDNETDWVKGRRINIQNPLSKFSWQTEYELNYPKFVWR